jgi:hypothetical protein
MVEQVGTVPADGRGCVVEQGLEGAVRLGLRGENALDRLARVGGKADGTLQGGDQVAAGVGAQQGQDRACLRLAVALVAEQALEEAAGDRAQLGVTLPQQR